MDGKTNMNVKIICPYLNDGDVVELKRKLWDLPVHWERDFAGIGSDMMYQKLWNKYSDDDIFILHSDMYPLAEDDDNNWFKSVLEYVDKYPEAGMFGCLLLYPAKDEDENIFIQSAGGKFTDNNPDHFGSGLCLETQGRFKEDLEIDTGQYNHVREVAWTTFGGIYIRREVFNKLGNFSPEYEWTYNRDVDYCLRAREAGFKIYQIPVRLIHFESRDNKKIKANDQNKVKAEMRNLQTLKEKWENTEFYKTLDEKVND
tara:strand:+ start:1616 stop:2389 length:774 start_codon:yes stop_codon:yes gene_type:complete